MKLKRFKVNDEIKTRFGSRWKTPFYVKTIYKGWVVATNERTINWVYLFIKTYTGEVYYGSSRYAKYGLRNIEEIEQFLEEIIRGERKLDDDAKSPMELILDDSCFEINEKREQVYERD